MGVVIPCDSVEWHDNREAFFKDRERRSRLQALGHPVIEVTSQRLETFGYEVACDILGARSLFRRAG